MATVNIDTSSVKAYRWTHSPSRFAWSEGRQPLGAVHHSSDEPGELSKWLVSWRQHDSTINIVPCIVIILLLLTAWTCITIRIHTHKLCRQREEKGRLLYYLRHIIGSQLSLQCNVYICISPVQYILQIKVQYIFFCIKLITLLLLLLLL